MFYRFYSLFGFNFFSFSSFLISNIKKGPQGPKTLCNACGLHYAKKTDPKKRKIKKKADPSAENSLDDCSNIKKEENGSEILDKKGKGKKKEINSGASLETTFQVFYFYILFILKKTKLIKLLFFFFFYLFFSSSFISIYLWLIIFIYINFIICIQNMDSFKQISIRWNKFEYTIFFFFFKFCLKINLKQIKKGSNKKQTNKIEWYFSSIGIMDWSSITSEKLQFSRYEKTICMK